MPFRDWRGLKVFNVMILGCGNSNGILGSYSCISLLHSTVERSNRDFPLLKSRCQFSPKEAVEFIDELSEVRKVLSDVTIRGANYLNGDGGTIRWVPEFPGESLFHSGDSKFHVAVNKDGLWSLDENVEEAVVSKSISKGEKAFDVWVNGPWGMTICIHRGVCGELQPLRDINETTIIEWSEKSGLDVFGGMIDFLEEISAESDRTQEKIRKYL